MMKRLNRAILTFRTTTDAMAMEEYCTERGLEGRLIPVPGEISAGCGMCWSAPPEARKWLEEAARAAGICPEGVYELLI